MSLSRLSPLLPRFGSRMGGVLLDDFNVFESAFKDLSRDEFLNGTAMRECHHRKERGAEKEADVQMRDDGGGDTEEAPRHQSFFYSSVSSYTRNADGQIIQNESKSYRDHTGREKSMESRTIGEGEDAHMLSRLHDTEGDVNKITLQNTESEEAFQAKWRSFQDSQTLLENQTGDSGTKANA